MLTELQQTKGSYFILITEIKIKIIIAFGETSRLTMCLFCHPWWGKEIKWMEKKMLDIKKVLHRMNDLSDKNTAHRKVLGRVISSEPCAPKWCESLLISLHCSCRMKWKHPEANCVLTSNSSWCPWCSSLHACISIQPGPQQLQSYKGKAKDTLFPSIPQTDWFFFLSHWYKQSCHLHGKKQWCLAVQWNGF